MALGNMSKFSENGKKSLLSGKPACSESINTLMAWKVRKEKPSG